MQTKKHSFVEAATNIVIGYCFNFFLQLLIFPIVGLSVTITQNIQIGLLFTCFSLMRMYLLRRLFNKYTDKKND